MKLVIEQQEIELKKDPSSDEVIEKIKELIAADDNFSHFIADGTEVYENHEEYLNLNLDRISKLEVIAKSEKKFMNDVLNSAEEYLRRANSDLVALSQEFQNSPTKETWASFEMLLEGAQWLNDMLVTIGESKERPVNWEAYVSLAGGMQGELAKLGQAVEKENHEQIGDIIRDGLISTFEALEVEIGKTIDAEGIREYLN
ncbi:hypothetical protein [Sporosarcina sp. YIM B06819]|uniref:hypothetical protein n=1 Tax=Sporosarcina sp. YIM B06819 TaxID=3081769 RepID=UPI00298CFB49|nr:hypothetical protein [Sporosarcina sp. YIM B06819]